MMKKWLLVFLATSSLIFAITTEEKEEKAKDLCTFTNEVFTILSTKSEMGDQKNLEKLHKYEKDPNPEIAALAGEFITSFKVNDASTETLGNAVSSLGRLVKCSVDDEYYRFDTSYLLHKGDIQKELALMEGELKERCPKGKYVNYHKLMIESLADEEYDLALYSYLKIAETRCQTKGA